MKKFILIVLIFLAGSLAVQAQVTANSLTRSKTTLTNADTGYLTATVSGSYETSAFSVVVTKLTGTLAGSVAQQVSLDGTNYATLSSTALADGANVLAFSYSPTPYAYYRFRVISTGTSTASISGQYLLRMRR